MAEHGGDIYNNEVNIDLSVNISPYGMPPMVRAAVTESLLHTGEYPDPEYRELRQAIGEMEKISAEEIICGNGASEIIYAMARAICRVRGEKNRVGLLVPCFSEYKKAFEVAGVDSFNEVALKPENNFVATLDDIEKCVLGVDVVFLGNPNNPTGRLLPRAVLEEAIKTTKRTGAYLILDESFIGLSTDVEELVCDEPHIIRIKSFTKSMAMPGIRLGYCVCRDESLRAEIKKQLPEWNVSVIASMAGIAASKHVNWLEAQVNDNQIGLKNLRSKLTSKLQDRGIKVYPSDTCFLLVQSEENLYEEFLAEKVLIRKCDNFTSLDDSYYRIAVKLEENHGELMQVLPTEIEKRSFEIITSELLAKGINVSEDKAAVVKRCIHTTADFEYANSLFFSEDAIGTAKRLIREGAHIVTDTNMALSGINKKELAKYGGSVHCFMADEEIAKKAKEQGCTRATMSMRHATTLEEKLIFVVGNAPTALVTLAEMTDRNEYTPEFVIGVPVGFVNVEAAKNMIIERKIPSIVNRGRKGGSNVAAAIVNAILYEMRDEVNE